MRINMQEKFSRLIAGLLGFLLLIAVPPLLILVSVMCLPHFRASILAALRELARSIRQIRWSDYPPAIVHYMQGKLSPAFEKINAIVDDKYANQKLLMGLASIAVLGAVLLLSAHLRGANVSDDYLEHCFKQLLITVTLGISIIGLAWVLLPLKNMFESAFVKFVFSAVVTLCIVFSRLLATDFFSTHFPFPPSYMSLAFALAVGIIATSFASLIFASFTLLFELFALLALSARELKGNRGATIFLAGVALLGLIGAYISSFAVFEGISPKGQLFMVKLAQKYDFTTNHMCETEEAESVLFIENVSDRAIAATFPSTEKLLPTSITPDTLPNYLPGGFRVVRCNPLPVAAKTPGWCEKPSRFGFCETNK